jgi:hypothetical protein
MSFYRFDIFRQLGVFVVVVGGGGGRQIPICVVEEKFFHPKQEAKRRSCLDAGILFGLLGTSSTPV